MAPACSLIALAPPPAKVTAVARPATLAPPPVARARRVCALQRRQCDRGGGRARPTRAPLDAVGEVISFLARADVASCRCASSAWRDAARETWRELGDPGHELYLARNAAAPSSWAAPWAVSRRAVGRPPPRAWRRALMAPGGGLDSPAPRKKAKTCCLAEVE